MDDVSGTTQNVLSERHTKSADVGAESMDRAAAAAILNAVGARLRTARLNQGLSLAEAAARLYISDSVLSRLERAGRDSGLLRLIMTSSALGMRLSDVLRLAEDDAFPLGSAPWTVCRTTASHGVTPADE
ncbi:MAG TPA: helix-turn-helix domain-containing protein [Pseudonocardiaceae bacterium]|nr:helix-turn-helix domain-containing protein [Pseudonocardiaceae bacterium]